MGKGLLKRGKSQRGEGNQRTFVREVPLVLNVRENFQMVSREIEMKPQTGQWSPAAETVRNHTETALAGSSAARGGIRHMAACPAASQDQGKELLASGNLSPALWWRGGAWEVFRTSSLYWQAGAARIKAWIFPDPFPTCWLMPEINPPRR